MDGNFGGRIKRALQVSLWNSNYRRIFRYVFSFPSPCALRCVIFVLNISNASSVACARHSTLIVDLTIFGSREKHELMLTTCDDELVLLPFI